MVNIINIIIIYLIIIVRHTSDMRLNNYRSNVSQMYSTNHKPCRPKKQFCFSKIM